MLNHDIEISLLLALFIMTLLGAGSSLIVGIVGVMLCVVGAIQQPAAVDLRILLPLIFYNAISMAASYAAGESIVEGYVSMQAILPVIYLLLACLDDGGRILLRRLCVLWAGAAAAAGILRFTGLAMYSGAGRLGWPLGNPNALGCLLVLGWFALLNCCEELPEPQGRRPGWGRLPQLEPVLLMALALTLSMESFLAMAAGILVLLIERKRRGSWRDTVLCACRVLAKAALGVGSGVLLFLAADRTGCPWLCLPVLVCGVWAAACWRSFGRFLEVYPWMAALLSGAGVLVAGAAVVMRPSSIATFLERLEMMRDGLGYLAERPLLGVGPYHWRLLNLYSGEKYFNTWFIHNSLIHISVELGLIAAAAVLLVLLRFCRKRKTAEERGMLAAFFAHNMLDVTFFVPSISAMLLLSISEPRQGGKQLGSGLRRILFGVYFVHFLRTVCHFVIRF